MLVLSLDLEKSKKNQSKTGLKKIEKALRNTY